MCDGLLSMLSSLICQRCFLIFLWQAEDGIRDLVRSRGLGDVYKRQISMSASSCVRIGSLRSVCDRMVPISSRSGKKISTCLLYTSDAADERSSVDLGGRRIIKKKKNMMQGATGTA